MNPAEAGLVALYNGSGGCGVIEEHSEGAALIHFLDGAKVWCAPRNLTPCRHDHGATK